ncbi:MAG: glycosyltransferase family 2 protein [Patescibacteria group bacterium]
MRLTAGLLTHNSEQYASRCLETLVAQTGLGILGKDWQIVCLDNASEGRIALARLESKFRNVIFQKEHRNLGFSKAHNLIMRTYPAEFHAVLNIDVLFAPDYLTKLLAALEKYPHAGSAVGKLRRWKLGEGEERTNIIDSAGISATKTHAFSDRGQGETDHGQYDEPREIFGGTGAAVVYRRSALENIAYVSTVKSQLSTARTEFFDETMFMYKEDIDLAYRLLVAGHPCRYVPEAFAWHARGSGKEHKRRKRRTAERVLSTAHETLLLRKHQTFWPAEIQRRTAVRQCARWTYLSLLEPHVFFGARKLLRSLREEALKRQTATKHTVPFADLTRFFT